MYHFAYVGPSSAERKPIGSYNHGSFLTHA